MTSQNAQEVKPTAGGSSVVSPERLAELLQEIAAVQCTRRWRDIGSALRELQQLRAGWRDIATAPRDGHFLVYTPDEVTKVQAARHNANGVFIIGNAFAFDLTAPTHWMPLPPPPEERADG